MTFILQPRLKQDCIELGRFQLCLLLLMNDNQYPWFILVPEKPEISEIYQLNKSDRILMIEESSYLSEKLAQIYDADKMNIASLGNIVSQLHIHHIVRYQTDKTWPGPVWGKLDPIPYAPSEIATIKATLATHLSNYNASSS
jgi:diadenosine tetraphosphate (Ap4A) HIT family hydrolase